jgi:pyridoxal 5'-phosphate synthase pdxS subunit
MSRYKTKKQNIFYIPERAVAMAQAVTHYKDPKILAELSSDLGSAMFGMPVNRSGKSSSYSKTGSEEKNIWDATLGDPAKFPVNQVH